MIPVMTAINPVMTKQPRIPQIKLMIAAVLVVCGCIGWP
jgi:hypothetical protein